MADRTYQTSDRTSNRNYWEFSYTGAKLAAAASAQMKYRNERVGVWTKKKDEVMTKIKESGLNVHESLSEKMSTLSNSYNPMGNAATITVDTTLQKDLNECVSKIQMHRELAKTYEGWIQVLKANPESELRLTHEDWMFFFGK